MKNTAKIDQAVDHLRQRLDVYPRRAEIRAVTVLAKLECDGEVTEYGIDDGDEPISGVQAAGRLRPRRAAYPLPG